jgi:hypothetical protein
VTIYSWWFFAGFVPSRLEKTKTASGGSPQ